MENPSGPTGFRITPHMVLGFLVVLIGIIFTLDNLDIVYAHEFLRYWPVLLIVYGAVKVAQPERHGSRFWGIVLMFVGAALLADKLDIFYFRLWDLWPLLLVGLGVMMILRSSERRQRLAVNTEISGDVPPPPGPQDGDSIVNASAILGGTERNIHSKDFRGGEITSVMGGCDIDLLNAAIANSPAILDVFAFWGGIQIKVPQSWEVSFEGTPILGGFGDKTFHQGTEPKQRLIVRGTVVMGGVEVRN